MHRLFRTYLLVFPVSLLLWPVTSAAMVSGYSPLTQAELNNRFTVVLIGEIDRNNQASEISKGALSRMSIGPSGAVTQITSEGDLMISGKDKNSLDWQYIVSANILSWGASFYKADLDNNGIVDLMIVFNTGGNGLAPSTHLIFIMFDSSGRPIPFEADGYSDSGKNFIDDVVDIDGDGKAELIYMNFNDGYWITSLYHAQDARWVKVVGQLGKREYPLYTRFTNHENHQQVRPANGKHPLASDLSNNSVYSTGRLLSYKWAKVNQSEDITLIVEDSRGHKTVCSPASWYSTFAIVVDKPERRMIVSLNANEKSVQSLLNEIVQNGYDVSLYGMRLSMKRTSTTCAPELLWATPKK